ncbi:MAG TPA: hypothetical protein VGA55_01825, partial [Bacteroidota bacterium]
LKKILAADIHPAIKMYFKAEVEKMLTQERSKEVRSGRFPYGLPEVKGLQRQIDLSLVHQYEFDRQEFESLLDESVHFQFNYLCRPRWTLQEFMFENRRTAAVGEILRKLKYCVEYRYLGEIFKRHVSERGLAEIGYEEFRTVIEKIDGAIVSQHSAAELARMLKPLVEFVEVGIPDTRISETGPVLPMNAAVVFFEDKKMEDIKKRLEEERDKNGVSEVSIPDLARMIRDVKGEKEPADAPAVSPKIVSSEEFPGDGEDSEVPREIRQAVAQKTAVPVDGKKPGNRKPSRPPIADIYSLFTLKEQKLFVRKLFKKDEVEFRNALDKLNALLTWKDASLILDEVFSANSVDPFSKEAVLFTDKIFGRYAVAEQTTK